jgi:enoyl-[acyl-carrier protein] reductase/trans-2-enoyl-CoA reductase (NAD+)
MAQNDNDKDDLEKTALALNAFLKEKYEGEGLISVSKAVVTKASVFIPRIPFYVSAMFEVMKAKGTHETILAHKNRLFSEMVYGDKRLADEKGRFRIDAYEMDDATQLAIQNLSQQYQGASIFSLEGTQQFIDEFYQINGFRIPGVNYEEDVDLSSLSLLEPQ